MSLSELLDLERCREEQIAAMHVQVLTLGDVVDYVVVAPHRPHECGAGPLGAPERVR